MQAAHGPQKPCRAIFATGAALLVSCLPFAKNGYGLQADMGAYVDAKKTFMERQETLVNLAAVLGALHHLRDICIPDETPQKWRGYMKALIALEHPIETTQNRMIDAFNTGYQDMKSRFSYCDTTIREETYHLADQGARHAGRLGSHFLNDQDLTLSLTP